MFRFLVLLLLAGFAFANPKYEPVSDLVFFNGVIDAYSANLTDCTDTIIEDYTANSMVCAYASNTNRTQTFSSIVGHHLDNGYEVIRYEADDIDNFHVSYVEMKHTYTGHIYFLEQVFNYHNNGSVFIIGTSYCGGCRE